MTLERIIAECIAAKPGNKEFALFFDLGTWTAMVGNPSPSVTLGEVYGEVVESGETATEAVTRLLAATQAWTPPKTSLEVAQDFLRERDLLNVEIE